jgi:predicted transcriptional regulator
MTDTHSLCICIYICMILDDVLDKKLEELADWIRNAKHFIVFTG